MVARTTTPRAPATKAVFFAMGLILFSRKAGNKYKYAYDGNHSAAYLGGRATGAQANTKGENADGDRDD